MSGLWKAARFPLFGSVTMLIALACGGEPTSATDRTAAATPTTIVLGPIVAVSGTVVTDYAVDVAGAPSRDTVQVAWSGATCGGATATGNRYAWDHRERSIQLRGGLGNRELGRLGDCDHRADPAHVGAMIVADITGEGFSARCMYQGSASGTGSPCDVTQGAAQAAAPVAPTPAGPALGVTETPAAGVPTQPTSTTTEEDDGLKTPLLVGLGLLILIALLILLYLLRRMLPGLLTGGGGAQAPTEEPLRSQTREPAAASGPGSQARPPKDRSWIPPITFPPVIYGEDLDTLDDWALYLWDGETWVAVRDRPGAIFEFRLRIVSNYWEARSRPIRTRVTGLRSDTGGWNTHTGESYLGKDWGGLPLDVNYVETLFPGQKLEVVRGQLSPPKGQAVRFQKDYTELEQETRSLGLGAQAESWRAFVQAHCVRDGETQWPWGVGDSPVKVRAYPHMDDQTFVEVLARSQDASCEQTEYLASGQSSTYREQEIVAGGLADVTASTHVESFVHDDLPYSVSTVRRHERIPESDPIPRPPKPEDWLSSVIAGIGDEVPGFTLAENVSALLGVRGGATFKEIEELYGENSNSEKRSKFNILVVNRGQAAAAVQVPGNNDEHSHANARVQAFHHITLQGNYGGPKKAWATTAPHFTLEIKVAGARAWGAEGDAKLRFDDQELVLRRRPWQDVTPPDTYTGSAPRPALSTYQPGITNWSPDK